MTTPDPSPAPELVPPTEAPFLDLERAERVAAAKVRWWDAQRALAELHNAQLDVKRCAARWDDRYDPPKLLQATVRVVDPLQPPRPRRKIRRKEGTHGQ